MTSLALEMTLMEAAASGSIEQEDQLAIESLVAGEKIEEALNLLKQRRIFWIEIVVNEASAYLKEIQAVSGRNDPFLEESLNKTVMSSRYISEIRKLENLIKINDWEC